MIWRAAKRSMIFAQSKTCKYDELEGCILRMCVVIGFGIRIEIFSFRLEQWQKF